MKIEAVLLQQFVILKFNNLITIKNSNIVQKETLSQVFGILLKWDKLKRFDSFCTNET